MNRYFYKYQPPRPLEEIEADIKALETDILDMAFHSWVRSRLTGR